MATDRSSDVFHEKEPPIEESDKSVEAQESKPNEKPQVDEIPDGGYGWVCVACNFWINAHTWGMNSVGEPLLLSFLRMLTIHPSPRQSFGVFLSYYLSNDVFPHTNALTYAFMGGLSMASSLLVAPLATYLIHRLGNRTVRNIGVFFETLSFVGASFATQGWHLFLSQD